MEFVSELKEKYLSEIRKELVKELDIENVHAVPNLEKIVINSGVGAAKDNPEMIDQVVEDITLISGQKPIVTKSKESISNFKIREGMPIGVKVTLRGIRMWFFLEKLIHIVLPRVRDFRGVSRNSFDGNGNYSLGLKDQMVFPEIDSTEVKRSQGLQITICTSAEENDSARVLLEKMGFPFEKKE